jgi:hypothetical protein
MSGGRLPLLLIVIDAIGCTLFLLQEKQMGHKHVPVKHRARSLDPATIP